MKRSLDSFWLKMSTSGKAFLATHAAIWPTPLREK